MAAPNLPQAGLVTNGAVRDWDKLRELDFPVFCTGADRGQQGTYMLENLLSRVPDSGWGEGHTKYPAMHHRAFTGCDAMQVLISTGLTKTTRGSAASR